MKAVLVPAVCVIGKRANIAIDKAVSNDIERAHFVVVVFCLFIIVCLPALFDLL